MEINLKKLTVPQLLEMKRIITNGPLATAEEKSDEAADKSYLCHKSPPAGYPKEKSEYGDPACYRYPLNTKARCLAAWRYVHHADNSRILGGKLKSVESKIRRYAKEHYNLDLEVGESATSEWAKYFMEYYDSETMGERFKDAGSRQRETFYAPVKDDIERRDFTVNMLMRDMTS
jgi:hypothetical protein